MARRKIQTIEFGDTPEYQTETITEFFNENLQRCNDTNCCLSEKSLNNRKWWMNELEGVEMNTYEKALQVMNELFAKDSQFAMATVKGDKPSVRFVDAFYDDGSLYVVTYLKSQKVQEINDNSQVALCKNLYRFSGNAHNIGHPLLSDNREIREKLIKVFEPWYFEHNNENDADMCYLKIGLDEGFFYKDGVGYKLDFHSKKAEEFPFNYDIVSIT